MIESITAGANVRTQVAPAPSSACARAATVPSARRIMSAWLTTMRRHPVVTASSDSMYAAHSASASSRSMPYAVRMDAAISPWRDDAMIELPIQNGGGRFQRPYADVMMALLRQTQRQTPATLGSILVRHAMDDPTDRIAFLKLLARRLAGRLEPLDVARAGWSRPKARLRQWAIGAMGAAALTQFAARR